MKTLTAFIIVLAFTSCGGHSDKPNDNEQTPAISDTTRSNLDMKREDADLYKKYIDVELRLFFDKQLHGWTIPSPRKWDTTWFNMYKTESSLVNYISGDFDCNSSKDYAAIINYKGNLAVYAFLSAEKSFKLFKLTELEFDNLRPIEFGLELSQPGLYNYLDLSSDGKSPSIKIDCHAVTVLNFERTAGLFFWNKGAWKTITVGD